MMQVLSAGFTALASASRVLQKAASLVDHTCPLLASGAHRRRIEPVACHWMSAVEALGRRLEPARGEGWHVALPLRAGVVGGLEQPGAVPRHGALRRTC